MLIALLLAVVPAFAAVGPHSRVDLIAETDALQAGSAVQAGLLFTLEPEWHIYWINAGDSGTPPKAKWTADKGVTAGPILWPLPERIEAPPLVSYGYSKKVLLPFEAAVDEDAKGAKRLRGKVDWLVCKVECLPASGTVELKLPVRKSAPRPSTRAGLFSETRRALPHDPVGWSFSARASGKEIVLSAVGNGDPGKLFFFPEEGLVLEEAALQPQDGNSLRLTLSSQRTAHPERLKGVLVSEKGWGDGRKAARVDVPVSSGGLARALLLAFLGGLLLNLMPCVFPVLSIKVLGALDGKKSGKAGHGLAYAAGVIASFWALAGLLLALRASGQALGWGFQLQSPVVVAGLCVLFVLIGLNLLGVFEIGTSLTRLGGKSGGAFWTGALATVAATPCTAPFMGAALGFALTRPAVEAFAVFTALAAGMALPFSALTAWPAALRFLPKPGAWMETFKKVMAVPMFLTAGWLLWVFWLQTAPARQADGWSAYSPEALERAKGPVFVDFTAAWCLTCQVNERTALADAGVKDAFEKKGVLLLKADWTNRDEKITKALAALGRAGVPVYALYAKPGLAPRLLPAILTPGIVLDALSPLPQKGENR